MLDVLLVIMGQVQGLGLMPPVRSVPLVVLLVRDRRLVHPALLVRHLMQNTQLVHPVPLVNTL